MNYRIILSVLFLWSRTLASDIASEPTRHPQEHTTESTQLSEEVHSTTVTIDNQTRLQIISLYDSLRIIEDDLDRLDVLERSNEDVEQIRSILETKKIEVLNQLSHHKGFEYLANVSHKQRFTSRADYTILEIGGYSLLTLIMATLIISSVNFAQLFKGNSNIIGIPSNQCVDENLEAIKNLVDKTKSFFA